MVMRWLKCVYWRSKNRQVSFLLMSVLVLSLCSPEQKVIKDGIYLKKIQGKSHVFFNRGKIDIKGVAGYTNLREARLAGATVIRTWNETGIRQILDSALLHELYVILGIHIDNPFRNTDADETIARQNRKIEEVVSTYKDHPALLFWAVGNEVDPYGRDFRVWRQLNRYIRMVKSIDRMHPVTTAIINGRRTIALSKIFLRDLDILSINAFGGIWALEKKLGMPIFSWDGPVIISEWGINGPWEENERTTWGAPIENTSSMKVEILKERFETYLEAPDFDCIGSFIFYWGTRPN